MIHRRRKRSAFTLIELLVVVSIIALLIAILLPSLARGREQARRAQCGAGLRTIATAYQLWASDNAGFLPPRCSSASDCPEREVNSAFVNKTAVTQRFRYRGHSSIYEDGLGIVGQPLLKKGGTDLNSVDSYLNSNSFPLNPYILPEWKVPAPMHVARCPSDVRTLAAANDDVEGIPKNGITSCFEIHGTSYSTNIFSPAAWRGHGPWARAVGDAVTLKTGPNFAPDKVYMPSRYIVMVDMANFYENWSRLIGRWLGTKTNVGRWHEAEVSDPWINANAMFLDGHVALGQYHFPPAWSPFQPLDSYVKSTWSLYPYQWRPSAFGS